MLVEYNLECVEKSSRNSLFTVGNGLWFLEGGRWGTVDHLLVRLCACISLIFNSRMGIQGRMAVNVIKVDIMFIEILEWTWMCGYISPNCSDCSSQSLLDTTGGYCCHCWYSGNFESFAESTTTASSRVLHFWMFYILADYFQCWGPLVILRILSLPLSHQILLLSFLKLPLGTHWVFVLLIATLYF